MLASNLRNQLCTHGKLEGPTLQFRLKFTVYFSIKTYLFYFTLLFFKTTTLNYLFAPHFIKYYLFINFYLFINSPKSYFPFQWKPLSLSHTVLLSKPITQHTHTHNPHGNHSLTSPPPTPPRQINSKSIQNLFYNDSNNQILLDLIGDHSRWFHPPPQTSMVRLWVCPHLGSLLYAFLCYQLDLILGLSWWV